MLIANLVAKCSGSRLTIPAPQPATASPTRVRLRRFVVGVQARCLLHSLALLTAVGIRIRTNVEVR